MKHFIMSAGALTIFVLALMFFGFLQYATSDVVRAWTKVSEEECMFKSWSKSGGSLLMDLDCGGKTKQTGDDGVIFAYLKNSVDTLPCTIWASGSVTCKIPDNAPKNTEQK